MLDKLNYSQKNKLLFVVVLLMMIIVYFSTIKKTVVTAKNVHGLEKQLTGIENAPVEINQLQAAIAKMENTLNVKNDTNSITQEQLLEVIGYFCESNHLAIREFPQREIQHQKDFNIETAVIKVEGGYSKIVRLIYLLEQQRKYGRMASVDFYSKQDLKTKKISLNAVLYFQLIKKNNDE
jgi:DNA gyrase/topoisomerase IV subunit A